MRRWFAWREDNHLDPLVGIHRAYMELFIRHLGECGLMPSSINTMMHGTRGYLRFADIDGLIPTTRPCTPDFPRCTKTRAVPKGWTGWS